MIPPVRSHNAFPELMCRFGHWSHGKFKLVAKMNLTEVETQSRTQALSSFLVYVIDEVCVHLVSFLCIVCLVVCLFNVMLVLHQRRGEHLKDVWVELCRDLKTFTLNIKSFQWSLSQLELYYRRSCQIKRPHEGGLSILYSINFGHNIPYPVNSCSLYPQFFTSISPKPVSL